MSSSDAATAADADRPAPGALYADRIAQDKAKRGKSRDVRPLARLAPYMLRHKPDLALAATFLVLAAGASLALPVAARGLIDGGFATGDIQNVRVTFTALLGVAIAMALFSASRFYYVTKLGERVVCDLRADVYDHLIGLSPSFFARTRTGEALSRLTVDAALIETLVTSSASMAIRNALMLVGGLAMMFATNAKLAFMVLLIIPAVLVPIFGFGRQVRRLSTLAQDKVADAAGNAAEALDGIETIQAFGAEARARAGFRGAVEASFAAAKDRIRARAIMTAIAITVVFGGISLVLYQGATGVMSGEITGGELAQFVLLAVLTGSGAGALAEVWGDVQKAAGATQRLAELLDERPDIAAPAAPVALARPVAGAISFDDVQFAYPLAPDRSALKGVSFSVGPSGSGKSTILRLLLRFYDPQGGAVRLDGVEARSADPAEWRRAFAYVSQNPDLFSGSAADNIRLGAPGVDDALIEAAARQAEAWPFIEERLGGLDKAIGDRGKALSGGERQRLAIARALARSAPVLLLDEATSALDSENELLVQKAFDAAMKDRTTIVIAHRLSTILRADRILVMEDGQIVEQGRHADLVARGGLYARLARLQFDVQAA
jgi:ATP-binding cassette subfamily B protein